jgi:hypothetical protein
MAGVLDGIRVVEVAAWGYVPSAGVVLADWGAEVFKVEHPDRGDPMRGLRQAAPPSEIAASPRPPPHAARPAHPGSVKDQPKQLSSISRNTVRHHPKPKCQASTEVIQPLKWGGRGSNPRPTD